MSLGFIQSYNGCMRNLAIKRVVTIVDAQFTPEQWSLYTNDDVPGEVSKVATRLNNTLRLQVNAGGTRTEVETAMQECMTRFAKYGADDSEPHHFLNEVLDEIYGR